MSFSSRSASVLILILGAVGLVGCGQQDGLGRLQVKGVVNVNGEPLVDGSIALLATGGTIGPSVGGTIEKGKFLIPSSSGPVPGEYRVEITSYRPTGKKVVENSDDQESSALVEEIQQFLPEHYNEKSTLTVKIDPSTSSQLEFQLEVN